MINLVAEELEVDNTQYAFRRVHDDSVLFKTGENLSEVNLVLGLVCTGNQYIIDVNVHKLEAMQDLVDEPLKGLSCIPYSKRHSCDSGFRDIFG